MAKKGLEIDKIQTVLKDVVSKMVGHCALVQGHQVFEKMLAL